MKESVTYQGIVEEGMVKALQGGILRQGRKKFGAPSDAVQASVKGVNDPDRLAALLDRVLDVSSWEELLAAP